MNPEVELYKNVCVFFSYYPSLNLLLFQPFSVLALPAQVHFCHVNHDSKSQPQAAKSDFAQILLHKALTWDLTKNLLKNHISKNVHVRTDRHQKVIKTWFAFAPIFIFHWGKSIWLSYRWKRKLSQDSVQSYRKSSTPLHLPDDDVRLTVSMCENLYEAEVLAVHMSGITRS